jgi:hypothetical protein
MRDERMAATAVALALALAGASLSWAQASGTPTVRGYAELQYQKLDGQGTLADREWWVRSIQLGYARRFASTLDLSAQAQVIDLSYIGRADKSRVPLASLRLAHPWFGAFASYRPTSTTDALGVTVRQQQTLVGGYWSKPGLPRLDLSFDRRHQDAGAIGGEGTSTNRTALASHTLGPVAIRGGYADQTQQPAAPGAHQLFQRTWTGGTTLRVGARRASMLLQYDYSDASRQEADVRVTGTRMHAAAATGGLRFTPKTDLNLSYAYRRSRIGDGSSTAFEDQEGSLLLNHVPTRAVRLTAGGGVRTVRSDLHQDLEEYALVSASADGRVRPGWTGGAGVTTSLNWLPGDRPRRIDSYRMNSRMRLWSGMDLLGDAVVSVTGAGGAVPADSTFRSGRIVTQTSAGLVAVPLRPISIGYSIRQYRAGESIGRASVSSLSDAWDLQWRPRPSLQLSGNWATSQGIGVNAAKLRTTRANMQWTRSSAMQLTVAYTRSTESRREAGSVELPGREILGFRLLSGIGRDLRSSIGLNLVDPGRQGSARQVDATVTRRFGG